MMTRDDSCMPVACVRGAMAVVLCVTALMPAAALALETPRPAQGPVAHAQPNAAPAASVMPTARMAQVAPPVVQPAAPAPAGPAPGATAPGAPASGGPAAPAAAAPVSPAAPSASSGAADATPAPQSPDPAPPRPTGVANGALPHDLSPWGMFMAAAIVVKAVMVGLAFASVVTWTIWLVKMIELVSANRMVRQTLHVLRQSPTLLASARGLPKNAGAAGRLVLAALAEVDVSRALPTEGIKERVAISLNRIEAGAGRRMSLGTGLLATIGSTAPFVGLFGTVWGIMNSFIGISKSQTTSLAVVAPGIAEALLATAIGLVAAIPAVIIYNVFARAISNYKASLSDTSSEVMRHLSRDLDREQAGTARVRAAAE